jgi:hypothetical protein
MSTLYSSRTKDIYQIRINGRSHMAMMVSANVCRALPLLSTWTKANCVLTHFVNDRARLVNNSTVTIISWLLVLLERCWFSLLLEMVGPSTHRLPATYYVVVRRQIHQSILIRRQRSFFIIVIILFPFVGWLYLWYLRYTQPAKYIE